MNKSNTFNAVFSKKYVIAFALALLGSSLFILNSKDKTAEIAASDAAQATAPTVAPQQEQANALTVAPQQTQAATAPEAKATTPVKRVKSLSAKPSDRLDQALYAEAKAEKGNDEEAEEEKRRQQKKQSYAEFLKNEFEMTKDPATGKVPRFAAREALEAAKKAPEFLLPVNARGLGVNGKEALPTVTTTPRGPFNFAGRVRQVGIDRRDNNILIAGGASGAIMRSTNGGSSWTIVHPGDQINSFNCIVQHPHPDSGSIWYVGTGEPNSSARASDGSASYFGSGILKSINNGMTWYPLAQTQTDVTQFTSAFASVSKMVVDASSGTVYAALTNTIHVSQDTGTTWTSILGNLTNMNYSDIIKTTNGTYYAAIAGSGIWKSNVALPLEQGHWTKIAGTGATNTLGTGFDRIVLASSPADPNLVYALYNATKFTCPNMEESQARLERYNATANTWTDLTNNVGNCTNIGTGGTKVISPQSGYNLAIAVKPDDATLLYLGGTEIYRYNTTTNAYAFIGGDQGSPSGTNLHVDVHSLYFSDNTTLWSTNDGGVHKTNVTGAIAAAPLGFTWDRKTTGFNGYQFYRVDISPTTASSFVGGGAQDNANLMIPGGTTDGVELGGGDGVQHAIITGVSASDFNVLTSTQYGQLRRRTSAGDQGVINPGAGQFQTYFHLDKDNTNFLYFPSYDTWDDANKAGTGRKLFRSRIAASLTTGTITNDATTGYEELTGTGISSTTETIIKSIATSYNATYGGAAYTASNPNRKLYFANGNTVFRLNDPAFCPANTAAVNLSAPGTGNISDIAVNPLNDNEVLLTYSNFNTVSIYHTTNANAATPTWTAVEGDAAAAVGKASVRSALIVRSGTQTLYFVGTSTGLYATDVLSGGTTVWSKVGGEVDKIGFAPCVSMRLRTSDNNFSVGTYGSGLFQLSVPATVLPIELTTFTGKAVNKTNVLSWETASETDNKGFDIERSADGSRFETIGFVAGNGTTSKAQSYNFEDNTPLSNSYYRLKQWDNDGRFELSKVIQITQKTITKLNVYPNPVANVLTIETDLKGDYQIINIVGQTVLKGQTNTPNIDVSALPIGTYFLSVGKEQVKFIKQ